MRNKPREGEKSFTKERKEKKKWKKEGRKKGKTVMKKRAKGWWGRKEVEKRRSERI